MNRTASLLRLLLAAVVALGVVAGSGAVAGARPAQDVDMQTPDADPAIDDLVACLQGTRHLLVLFLIDESASLKNNDPDDLRVDAAESALDSLQGLATGTDGDAPTVEVALAAFSNEYVETRGWTPVDADSAGDVRDSLEEFRDRNSGIDTDFVNALSSGREALADRAAAITSSGDEAPCKAVLLFTDGGYDIAVRGDADTVDRLGLTKPYARGIELTDEASVRKAEAAGREAMCKVGGLADRVRSDDITLLTLALAGNVPAKSQRLLAAASAGEALGYTCGAPVTRPPGAYLPASGVDVLIARFDEVATRLSGGTAFPGEPVVAECGEDACAGGTRSFELDGSLRRAHLLALPAHEGAVVELTGPGGTTTIDGDGEEDLGGVAVTTSSVAGRGYAIDLQRPTGAEGWSGPWSAAILDPSGEHEGDPATLQVFTFSDVGIEFGKIGTAQRGTPLSIEATVVAPATGAEETTLATATATARFVDPVTGKETTVELEGPPTGPFTGTFDVPADLTTNAIEASLELRATTSSGAEIVSQAAPSELLVTRPKGSIQILPSSLEMPSVTNDASTSAELSLVGGDAPGCVWFGPTTAPNLPDGAGTLEVTIDGEAPVDQASCLPVAARELVTVQVEVDPSGRGTGTVSGLLELHEEVEGRTASTTQLGFRFDLARKVDEAQRLLLTVVLLVAGIAFPLLLLLLINTVSARFQTLDVVRAAVVPVLSADGTVQRLERNRGVRLALHDRDFQSLADAGNIRRFRVGGVEFRARAARNPFGATIALAVPEGGAEKLKGNEGSRVELDPGLAGSWVFLLDADQTRAAGGQTAIGTLIAFVAEGDVAAQTSRMVPDIGRRLPDTAKRLAGLVRHTPVKAAKPAKPAKAAKPAKGAKGAEATGADTAGDAAAAPGAAAPDEDPATIIEGLGRPADARTDTPADAPSTGEAGADGEVEAPDAPAPEPAADEAPATPLGFGGTAAAPPPRPVVPEPDDDGPSSPPLGFGGRPQG